MSSANFDAESPKIKREILTMIVQYLEEIGLRTSAEVLRSETRMGTSNGQTTTIDLQLVRNMIVANELEKLDSLQMDDIIPPRLAYAIHRHRFIVMLLSGDVQSALQFLSSRLRPFRDFEDQAADFDQLCVLVVDALSPSRTMALPDLEESLQRTLNALDSQVVLAAAPSKDSALQGRLTKLVQQAAACQLASYPLATMRSIIKDYVPATLPRASSKALGGHVGGAKAIAFVPESSLLVSGGNDGKMRVWDIAREIMVATLDAHRSRVWGVAATSEFVVSGGGDGVVRIWRRAQFECAATYDAHWKDVYAVDIKQDGSQVMSAGFDRKIKLWDVNSGSCVQTIRNSGKGGAITSVCFDASGFMAVSGGKDMQICVWDLRSEVCVRTLSPVLGEVTSVCATRGFSKILAATKNSTNRIWDLRMPGKSTLLKGHQNFSKSFVRARFGHQEETVISGSDDGMIYCWDADSGVLVDRTAAHKGGAFDVACSEDLKVFASCGADDVVRIWDQRPME